jgi:GNAT superfamily N-acetyltransferase
VAHYTDGTHLDGRSKTTTVDLSVRRIRADEGLELRALRLRALADSPMAFGSTLAREEAFAEHVWHERAAGGAAAGDRVTFIAERDGRWIGLATGLADDPDGSGPLLVGMFVDPAERGRGVGVALVEAVTDWARTRGTAPLSLWVTSSNAPAIALYERCGFRAAGDVRPLGHTSSLTEVKLVRELARA